MLGSVRFVLALMVVFHHLFLPILIGPFAVFGFYMMSGYLMNLVMHESYGFSLRGRLSFALNRFLRLYPQYWIACLFSVFLIIWFGEELTKSYHHSIFRPDEPREYLFNLLMIFPSWYPVDVNPRLVPPTWAITVELFFYAMICIGIAKTAKRTLAWFMASVAYFAASYYLNWPDADRYFPIPAASLPFSIGAALYFLSKQARITKFVKDRAPSSDFYLSILLINAAFSVALTKLEGDSAHIREIGFYINLLVCFLLYLNIIHGRTLGVVNKFVDKILGDFSYPFYLLHWQVGLVASYLLFSKPLHEFSLNGLVNVLVSIILLFIVSLSLVVLIDRPIEALRAKIKRRTYDAHKPKHPLSVRDGAATNACGLRQEPVDPVAYSVQTTPLESRANEEPDLIASGGSSDRRLRSGHN